MTIASGRITAVSRPPSALLTLAELPRALFEWRQHRAAGPSAPAGPCGDGHPVLVLPGFIAGDESTVVLRDALSALGYAVHGWELGRNLGPRAIGLEGEKLLARLDAIHAQTGRRVSLVGWSLGGLMARLIARRRPDAVRQVITFGAPFAGDPRATHVWRLYELLSGQKVDHHQARQQLEDIAGPPSVPSTAIYSRGDGIVAWQNCVDPDHAADNVEVTGSHCGMCANPHILRTIADRLARPERLPPPRRRR